MNKPAHTKDLISVAVTSYNHEPFIKQCIDSVLEQTYRNIEIRVIDDCSTDGTVDILRSYGDRIRLTLRDKNQGLANHGNTINQMIHSATGEFFYRLDSDDFLDPDYFERMIEAYRDDPRLDWVCGGLNIVDKDGRITDSWEYSNWPTDPDAALKQAFKACTVAMPHNGLFRTSFLQDNQLGFEHFPYGWGEDVLFTFKSMKCRPRVRLLDGAGFNWRTHGTNNSNDVVRRIELVIAIKQYFGDNVDDAVYLDSEMLNGLAPGSDAYLATKWYLLADDLYGLKNRFRIPRVFKSDETEREVDSNLYRFDSAIRQFADRSLACSDLYRDRITELLKRLESGLDAVEGRRILNLGDFQAAEKNFRKALDRSPDLVNALTGMTELKLRQGDIDAAAEYSANAVKAEPTNAPAVNNLGVIMFAKEMIPEAEVAFARAIKLDSDCSEAYINLAELYGHQTRRTLASDDQKANILNITDWLSRYDPDLSLSPMLDENLSLKAEAMRNYTSLFPANGEKILLHRPSNGALRYLMESWAETLNLMGLPTELLDWETHTADELARRQPTVFITVADPAYIDQLDWTAVKKYRSERRLRIGLITTLRHNYAPVDFYITFHRDPSRNAEFDRLDKPLLSLPFAITPTRHYMRPARQVWDFFFVGSNSPLKADLTKAILLPILENYQGILAGTNWPVGIGELPLASAAGMYGFAAICPNYHLRVQLDDYNEVNERTFVIPACGAFQIVDRPVALEGLFEPDELAVADSPGQFLDMFEHYLNNPEQRREITLRGMRRIWKEYTLFQVMDKLGRHLLEQPLDSAEQARNRPAEPEPAG